MYTALGKNVPCLRIYSTILSTTIGILAFDGDRTIKIEATDETEVTVRRDGPRIIDPNFVFAVAAEHGLLHRS